jgi:hypothetical protein
MFKVRWRLTVDFVITADLVAPDAAAAVWRCLAIVLVALPSAWQRQAGSAMPSA